MELGRSRRLRWAVPAGAVIAVTALIAGTEAATAQSSPALPSRTAAQLLASVARPAGPVPLTGTYTETASLGLPDLPGGSGPLSGLGLLSGTHTFMIWYGGDQEVRIAEPVQLGEADVRQFGNQVWLWNSRTQQATHIVLPATFGSPGSASPSPSPSGTASPGSGAASISFHRTPPTPQQLARQIMAAVGPTTVVSVRDNVTVAGQPAYQLALAPKDSRSLIGQVDIAIDASNQMPLRVQVFARGASSPAFQSGYTSLSFGEPAVSNFEFTAPPGAKVKTINVPAAAAHRPFRGRPGSQPGSRPGSRPVVGTGWLSVLVIGRATASAGTASAGALLPVYDDGNHVVSYTVGAVNAPAGAPSGTAGLAAEGTGLLRALLKAATPVHGSWGSGRLLRTSLLSVLFTSRGPVLVGAVTPAVLYADAAAVK
jgi:hypothetical protein